jgi:hypothetical protein
MGELTSELTTVLEVTSDWAVTRKWGNKSVLWHEPKVKYVPFIRTDKMTDPTPTPLSLSLPLSLPRSLSPPLSLFLK